RGQKSGCPSPLRSSGMQSLLLSMNRTRNAGARWSTAPPYTGALTTSIGLHRGPAGAAGLHRGDDATTNCWVVVPVFTAYAGRSAGTVVAADCCTVKLTPVAAAVAFPSASLPMVMVSNAWVSASTAAPPTSPRLGSSVTPYQGLKS